MTSTEFSWTYYSHDDGVFFDEKNKRISDITHKERISLENYSNNFFKVSFFMTLNLFPIY